ncbi:MAG: DUF2520 domain-containing protein [Bacteroidales bacterium]|jgi:predicted short-subunit dehydrogenase-like oxidoreductase (DUF2520 family)|nr:DUF2520 domain-containing protein [Bacteroidales bacterium]
MTSYSISFAGAGRVAGILCREMFRSGIKIRQIASVKEPGGRQLAAECNAAWSSELVFGDNTDIVIVAVPDHHLSEVLYSLKCSSRCIVAHTAGSFGLDVFPEKTSRKGVFYPLQTFSVERNISLRDVPFLIEPGDDQTGEILAGLAEKLGGKVHFIDIDRRKLIHLAAVFICNFTNHMLAAGNKIAEEAGVSLELFEPLLRETIEKALSIGPESAQTGPAVRNDLNTIEKHMDLLSFSPELKELYGKITQSIRNHHIKNS